MLPCFAVHRRPRRGPANVAVVAHLPELLHPAQWRPEPVRRELDGIHRWLEQAQRSRARLPGADIEGLSALRRIVDRLRRQVLEDAGLTSDE